MNLFFRIFFFNFISHFLGADFMNILFTCCINFSHYQLVCIAEGINELIKQRQCSSISMRLEQAPQCFMFHILYCRKRCLDFCWMVSIVINNLNTLFSSSKNVESSLCSFELAQCFCNRFRLNTNQMTAGKCRQRVKNIMLSRNR